LFISSARKLKTENEKPDERTFGLLDPVREKIDLILRQPKFHFLTGRSEPFEGRCPRGMVQGRVTVLGVLSDQEPASSLRDGQENLMG
jgi:hypothetical protein